MKVMLEGQEIRLRALEPSDLEPMLKWENNPEHWPVTNTYIPFSSYLLKNYITSVKDIYADKQFRFVIERISDAKAIGFIDLFEFDPFHQRAGVGILIGETKDRGNGHATEALELLIRYCDAILKLKSLFCNVGEKNLASLQLFKKNGFTISGTKESWFRNGDEWENEYFLQLQFAPKS